jgi:O-antigen chain-terminating methyltransferase
VTPEHEPLDATLLRLKRERDEADRRYNDALTALDRVVVRPPTLPHPPPVYDEHQVTPLNQTCDVLVAPAAAGGLKGRLAAFVWRIVAPTLQKQAAFNSVVVDHVNRNVAVHRATHDVFAGLSAAVQGHVEDLLAFRARLMLYLQQITPFVDTKDRDVGGTSLVVNAGVNALADELAKRQESMAARERRFEARVSALTAAHDELRALVGVSQQAALSVKRELERLTANAQLPTPDSQLPTPKANGAFAPALDAYKYVGFEDQFRGSREVIRQRLESYLPYFQGASDVLDVGCGRGEFLELLNARGVSARGLDLNHEMVEVCRARGLNVVEADVVTFLDGVADASLGGLFAAQVVEHLQPGYLLSFLELAHHKLRPGAPIVLETLNPACWLAFFESFIRDITHVWPLHPETLRYLVLASGFTSARIEYRSPVPPQDKLQPAAGADASSADLVEAFNANVEKLNARMFTFLDYAIVGTNA